MFIEFCAILRKSNFVDDKHEFAQIYINNWTGLWLKHFFQSFILSKKLHIW